MMNWCQWSHSTSLTIPRPRTSRLASRSKPWLVRVILRLQISSTRLWGFQQQRKMNIVADGQVKILKHFWNASGKSKSWQPKSVLSGSRGKVNSRRLRQNGWKKSSLTGRVRNLRRESEKCGRKAFHDPSGARYGSWRLETVVRLQMIYSTSWLNVAQG